MKYTIDWIKAKFISVINIIRHIYYIKLSLWCDKADNDTINSEIHESIILRGSTVWVLVCAIVIASIGLNINSIAVIIGAMLISPIMGPILGVGYSVGIYDFKLLKKSLINLSVAVIVAIVISFLYFKISPLSNAKSELLSRTSPTIWDVGIAFFSGIAGFIALTRKGNTTVIPGVAIATALIPPLCTSGYELAHLNFTLFLGAMYLFTINCVFIAFATTIMVWVMDIPKHEFLDSAKALKLKSILFIIVVVTLLPSSYLAVRMVENEVFISNSQEFIKDKLNFNQTYITNVKISPRIKQVEVNLMGTSISSDEIAAIKQEFKARVNNNASIVLHQASDGLLPVLPETNSVDQKQLYSSLMNVLSRQESNIATLESQIANLYQSDEESADVPEIQAEDQNLNAAAELESLYPVLNDVIISNNVSTVDGIISTEIILNAATTRKIKNNDIKKIRRWMQVRFKTAAVRIYINSSRR